jgi:hypothetical protein
MLEPGLPACDILLDLLDKGELVRRVCSGVHRAQVPAARSSPHRLRSARHRWRRSWHGAQAHVRNRTHLHRLENKNRRSLGPQKADNATLVAASGFYPDARNASLLQHRRKFAPVLRCVGDLPALRLAMDCDIELGLGRIDPAVTVLVCVIFVDPACEANQVVPATIGSMKS